jgi:Tol biopolymer transport system component
MKLVCTRALIGAVVVLGLSVVLSESVAASKFGQWSVPVNLGPFVNSPFDDISPHLSKDGLSLYFASTRNTVSFGGEDIWISSRATDEDPWGVPVNLGPIINFASNERAPALSRDGHFLFFNSDRPGGFGGSDIWVSWRSHIHDDFGWQEPVNLGAAINTAAFEGGAAFFESDDTRLPQLYFVSNRTGGAGAQDIYVSTVSGGWFGPAVRVAELSSPQSDLSPGIRHDGREILIASNRPGTLGLNDLWVATRRTILDVWSDPIHLGVSINSVSNETFPSLSSDGRTLFFNATRSDSLGGLDLYVVSR